MKIVSIAIQKGGAGKTTTTINLAAALRDSGKKCLLIALDLRSNLSESPMHPNRTMTGKVEACLIEDFGNEMVFEV